ncbi:hypothetical protein Hanom_Chr10g00897531 [Helianthus anomalus]
MSSTIFSSLTTFFCGNGRHSPPHPTISPQPTITLKKNHHGREENNEIRFRGAITRFRLWWRWKFLAHHALKIPSRKNNAATPGGLTLIV